MDLRARRLVPSYTRSLRERMDRDALWSMILFLEVVERGTLAGAARALHVTPSAVSKQIAKLEERLGVRLAQRTTRTLRLTTAGMRYRDHALRVVTALDDAEADVQSEERALRGRIRVSAPASLGQRLVAPIVARFVGAHPEVEVDLDLSERLVDLVSEGIDLAVRVVPNLTSSGLTARKLGVMEWVLVASPSYLTRRSTPRSPVDLPSHVCLELAHAEDRGVWKLVVRGRPHAIAVRPAIVSSSQLALLSCAVEGAGIARLPHYLVRDALEAGRLTRVLPRATASRRSVFALMPTRAFVAPRVRAFADVLARDLGRALLGAGDRAASTRSAPSS